MAFPDPIRIEGLNEFRRNLKRMDSDLAKKIRLAGNVAAKLVVNEAKPRVPSGPGIGGHAASSIKAASTSKAARISAGGAKYPYYPWLDFGGRVGKNKSIHRPFLKRGRYIWASYAELQPEIEDVLLQELNDLARSAGMDPV